MDWWWIVVALTAHLGPDADDRWARVLTRLDLHRAAAFHHADEVRLLDVYASRTAAADDADLIAAYRSRGARIEGALLLVERVTVRHEDGERVVLTVTDRLAPARVRWDDGRSTLLPRDRSSRREVVLRSTDDGWRISAVRR